MSQPQIKEKTVRSILEANGVDQSKVSVVAIRGYRLDSMGKPDANDRGIYDDAMILVTPRGTTAYNANTDPSRYRKGRGTGSGKGMAVLKPGIYTYGKGTHKNRWAFRQCEPVTVIRDGDPPYEDTGFFGINIHPGGVNGTSSEGCQTQPPSTFDQFRDLTYAACEEFDNPWVKNDLGQTVRGFKYVLVEEKKLRQGIFIPV